MKIINLVENTPGASGCSFEHGLSFYIETNQHKILLDAGATDAFLGNAKTLGIDLTLVDIVILSHGHYDHAGGILAFSNINPTAQIYLQKSAGGDYYSIKDGKENYIGIDKAILDLPQLCLLDGDFQIGEGLFLFTNITGRKYWAKSNLLLKEKTKDGYVQDEFLHEQCLVVMEGEMQVLLSGCAHNGILNILDAYGERVGGQPAAVISGFHMMKKGIYDEEEMEMIKETAWQLKKTGSLFYTGHCTGQTAFDVMKEIMGGQLLPIHSGDRCL